MAAIPSELGIQTSPLRPVASPVDTFVRSNAGQQLSQLGNALSGLAPELAGVAMTIKHKENEKQTIAGENKANELLASGKTWKQAVDEKLVDVKDNPFFIISAQNQFGKVLGNKYADELHEAVKQSPIADSMRPEDFDTFSAAFRKQWTAAHLGEHTDAYMTNAFNNTAVDAEIQQRHQFAQEAGVRFVNDTTDAFKTNMGGEIRKAVKAGTVEQLPAALGEIMLAARGSGLQWKTVNSMVVDAVLAQASENKDLSLLDKDTGILQKIKTKGGVLGDIAETTARVTAMRYEISGAIQNDHHNANLAHEAEVKSAVSTVWSDFNEAQRKARQDKTLGTLNIDQFTKRLDALGDSDAVATMISAHSAYISGNATIEDDEVKRRLNVGIHAAAPGTVGYVTQTSLNKALAAHQINNSTYDEYSSAIRTRDGDGSGGGIGKFFSDPMLNQAEKDLSPWFARDALGNLMPGQAQLMQRSVTYLRDQYIKWKSTDEGKTASWDTANKWLSKMIPESFAHFGNGTSQSVQKSFLDGVPQVNFDAPAMLVNPKKHLTHDLPAIQAAEKSYAAWKAGRGKISDAALIILQDAGVDAANDKAVTDYFKEQNTVAKKPRTSPTGTQ